MRNSIKQAGEINPARLNRLPLLRELPYSKVTRFNRPSRLGLAAARLFSLKLWAMPSTGVSFLLILPAILGALELDGLRLPVRNLLTVYPLAKGSGV